MQNSFYGGQPGVSFIIVAYYESVDEMIENFKKGPDYEAVHFDEHVLINTFYKDDPDNGKIYRRGYDYTNDMGGAVYVGTIVGPPGHSPMVEMTTLADVVEKYNSEEHDEHILSEGEYAPLYDLVPGKTDDGEYRDSIKWACCSIHNKDHWYTTAYIGFIWPYLVVDYEADSVSPYYNRDSSEAEFTNTNLVDRMDDESHPFWEKWHISVPKGIKGDTFENFRVVTASDDDGVESYDGQADDRAHNREILVYDYYHFDKEEGGEPVTIYLGDYNMITGITILDDGTITIEYSHDDDTQYVNLFKWIKEVTLDTTNGHFTIIYNYDTEADGTPTKYETDLAWVSAITMTHEGKVTIHHITGDQEDLDEVIQWVDAVTLDENGTLEIQFNTGDVTTWPNVLKWVTGVELTDDGDFKIEFNNGDDPYTTHLTWVNDITFETDGTISVHYNDGTDDFTYKNLIKWITSIELTDEGHFTIGFNNGDDTYETDLVWVREITFEEDGIVTVIYNNGQQVTYPNIKWITEISLAEDGSFHIGFNNGDEYDANLIWVTEVSFDEQGIVTVHFNNGTTQEYPNIKWITEISLAEDGSFHIGFNNGDEYDANLIWVKDLAIQTDGTVIINYNDGTSTEQTNLIKWIDSIELTDSGDFTIEFNNGDDAYTNHLTWVNSITVDNSGTVEIHYNDGVEDTTYTGLIKWITGISLTQDGTFTVDFNNGDSSYTAYLTWIDYIAIDDDGTIHIVDNQGNDVSYEQYIKMISDVSINTGDTEGTGNQKVHVKYNTGEEEDIGEPLNYIMRMEMVDSNYHLLVWYSDPAKRQEIIDEGKSYVFNGEDGWLDLGSVKDESGILIGTNYEYNVPLEITQDVIDEIAGLLNDAYPNGLEGTDLQGKVITVGSDEVDNKLIYAYDYNLNSWYYIGSLGDTIKPEQVILFDTEAMTKTDTLRAGGAFFVLEDYSVYG